MAASQDVIGAIYMSVGAVTAAMQTDQSTIFENVGNAPPTPSQSATAAQFQNFGVSPTTSQATTGGTYEYVLPKALVDPGSYFVGWGKAAAAYVPAVPVPSGMITWFDISQMPGYTDGQTVNTLIDFSGQTSHAPAQNAAKGLYAAANTPTGRPAVEMGKTANTSYHMTEYFLSGQLAEIFLVVKTRNTAVANGSWTLGPYTGGSDESYITYSDGIIYENFGRTTGNRVSFTPTLPTTSYRVYNVYANTSDWKAYLDGTQQAASATVTTPDWSSFWLLGEGRRSGGGTADAYFSGWMAELCLYNRVLTSGERTQMTNYLLTKHITG